MSLKPREPKENDKKLKRVIHIEDALVLLSVVALFFLGVLYRDRTWAQIILAVILVVMFTVFIRRAKRVKKALEDNNDERLF